jgi:hypothetical protein
MRLSGDRARISIYVPVPTYTDATGDFNREGAKEFCQAMLDGSPRAAEALRVLREESEAFLTQWWLKL